MKNFFVKSYNFRFFLIAAFIGILISIFPTTYNIIQLQKNKTELNKNIKICLKKSVESPLYKKSKLSLVCEPDVLAGLLNDSRGIQHKIIVNSLNSTRIKKSIWGIPFFIITISILFGILPLLWVFFLNRVSDISNAIRGNKK
jgi:hypothetical protein